MATFNKYNCFAADKYNGLHNLATDQLRVVLTDTAPSATDTVINGEISYTNFTPTGYSATYITTTSSTQTGGTYKLVLADLTMISATADTPQFRYVALFNATSSKPIGWYDYASEITLHGANGDQFVVDFSQANGVITDA